MQGIHRELLLEKRVRPFNDVLIATLELSPPTRGIVHSITKLALADFDLAIRHTLRHHTSIEATYTTPWGTTAVPNRITVDSPNNRHLGT